MNIEKKKSKSLIITKFRKFKIIIFFLVWDLYESNKLKMSFKSSDTQQKKEKEKENRSFNIQ